MGIGFVSLFFYNDFIDICICIKMYWIFCIWFSGIVVIVFWLVIEDYICNINVIYKENKRIEKYR